MKIRKILILTDYGISCDLFDICRRFSSIPGQAVKEIRKANKCPPRLSINNRLFNWFSYKTMIVYVSQVYSEHNEVLKGIF